MSSFEVFELDPWLGHYNCFEGKKSRLDTFLEETLSSHYEVCTTGSVNANFCSRYGTVISQGGIPYAIIVPANQLTDNREDDLRWVVIIPTPCKNSGSQGGDYTEVLRLMQKAHLLARDLHKEGDNESTFLRHWDEDAYAQFGAYSKMVEQKMITVAQFK